MKYTHVLFKDLCYLVTLEDDYLKEFISQNPQSLASEIYLVDIDNTDFDDHDGMPSRNSGGWSYGFISEGKVYAGAGPSNSLLVREL